MGDTMDIMARDPLMLNPDMAMVMDMGMDMDTVTAMDMDTMDIMAKGLLRLNLATVIMAMVMDIMVMVMVMAMDTMARNKCWKLKSSVQRKLDYKRILVTCNIEINIKTVKKKK